MKDQEQPIERLLLGNLPEEEREALETRAIEDPEFFERLLLAEADLVDARVRGELSPADRQRFDQGPGRSPRIQERLEIARLLADEVPLAVEPPQRKLPMYRRRRFVPLLAAAALALVVALPVFRQLVSGGKGGPAEPLVLQSSGSRAPVQLEPVLVPRGAAAAENLSIYLELERPVASQGYRVEALDPARGVVWRAEGLATKVFKWGEAVACEPPIEALLPAGAASAEVRFELFEAGSDTLLATYDVRLELGPP